MKIHEYQARDLFKNAGIPVSAGAVALTTEEAVAVANEVGYPVVLKSQVLVGGRGKAGGIKIVHNEEELKPTFEQLKNLTIKGYPVKRIYVVHAVDIKKEIYLALTIDHVQGDVVLIVSTQGGVDIEQTAKSHPEQIHKFYLQGMKTLDSKRWEAFIQAVFNDGEAQKQITKIVVKLIEVFFQYDCSLAEINPLVIDADGAWCAVDAKINFDDNALFRQEQVQELRDLEYEDSDELEAKECSLSFVKMDGNVGCIVNGAGLAMATMDVIKLLGGEPANFLDVGGSSSPEKVLNALRIILRNEEVKTILINIFGGITRCDDIANGIVEAKKQLDINVPLVVRLTGTNEEEAIAILEKNNFHPFSTMREAVQQAVRLAA